MKLKELRTRKYVALIMMIVIIGTIVGILKIGNMDFDKGKVKVSKAVINNVTSSLSANINEAAVDNLIISKGYDEIDYVIKYSLSTDENIKERNVIIEASLDDNEKYASFKDITNGDVTSTVSENRKNIKITVKNAKVNKENELKLVMKLEGAPNGYKVTPKIKIKEVSEEKYTNLNVQNVEVKNNSLTGNVQDEQSMNVSNIELALKKDGETIKKTYTDEDGNYVFSDIEEGEYNLEIDEDIYEKVSEEKVNISESSKLNIVVKEVTPYKIELKKQITEMTIVNGGNTTTYKYGNLDKVQQALRNVKNMTGEVKYKITVQNTGKKSGVVTVVKDEVPEGLTFNKEKNTSWEEKNGVLYNRSLEGITLNAGEKREEGLTLDIESTSEAKTYINKVTAKGEIYENIVYILDGKTYKEDTVLEGEKIKEPKVDNKDFKGWYTDKKYTNKYNFNNEVTKDLVLYGQTEEIKEYTVTYVDNEKIVKTEKVKENGSLTAPKVSKEGHTFKYWSEEPNGKEYDLNTKVTKNITLYSVYDINKYTVTFINEKEKYDEQQVEYGGNIEVPTSPLKKYYTFKYWSLEENGDSYDLNTKVTKDITLYSVYDINKYTVTFIDKGKEIDKQELEAGSVVIAPKVSMEGYKFKYWSEKENGKEYNLNLPITRNLTLYSVYEINKYNVEFYDSNKLIKTIKVDYDNTINSNEIPTVSKIGYTFTGWTENNKNFDFTTKIKENKKLYSKYEIIKNAVIFNDENRITTKKVDYNNKVEKIESQGKTGYTFKYWSTTQDGEEFNFNTLITESITLYAVYEINEYSVNFIDQGNVYGDTQKVKYNNVAVKPETDPIKEGYTFKYWSLEENGVAYDFNTKITKDITLYSVYSVNNYKVSFIDNGTKYIEDETIEYNKTAIKPETDPSKVGHTFKYWSLEENGTAYDFNTKITKDVTLYSVYSVNNYKVSFVDNGTKYIEDETIEYNKTAIKPETDPSKVGHTFKYWSLEENGIAYDFNTKITKDTTLYSVYEANEYTVKFMNGDNLFKQEQVKYGLKATKPSENPTREHNLFKTWTLNDKEYDFNLPVTDNLVLHSKYEEIEKPSISHVPTEWTNNKVTVTITSSHEDYKYLYKIDTGEYKEYTGPFDIDYNCTVVAKSVKENVDSITESHDITNIDKIKPIINSLNETNVSGTSFDINVSTIDNESGMKQIHIYKDDLLETTIVYNENYNEEKNSTYTFNDLVSGNDYKIKVIAEDVAGNLSEAKEITVKTEEKIVARIIGRENKLFEDENLYENFSSLERAIKACPSNQCTIEMVTDTKESVEVLEGQDITLNINGKTITGVKDTYTINNGGNLIIKDSTEEAGSIVNNAGVALKNETTGVLTFGELEEELVVSTTKPYINGGTFGVVNEYIDKNTKGRFNFYDGMIAGNVAIEGEVNDKPYLYNASVVTSDNRQVATLKILEDAEARIIRTGVYYTNALEAIEDTNKGYSTEQRTNTTLIQGFKTIGKYGFNFNSEDNTLSSETNKDSNAYTIIDLTGYENNQYLIITGNNTSIFGTSNISVTENDENGTKINSLSDTDTNITGTSVKEFKYALEKNKKYYVKLSHTVTSQQEESKFIISNIVLQNVENYVITNDTEFKTVSSVYGFDYDGETRTLKSNNQYTTSSTAFSYIEVDLTNETEDKELIINASLDTLNSSNVANIVVNENNSKLSSYSYNSLGYLSVYGLQSSQTFIGPYNYTKTLSKGKKYYVQFYYFKNNDNYTKDDYDNNNSKDQFIINSIDVVETDKNETNIDLSKKLKTNYKGFTNYDSSSKVYKPQSNYTNDKYDSYVKVDLTKSEEDQLIDMKLVLSKMNNIYITSNNMDVEKDIIINNNSNSLLSFDSDKSYYYIDGSSKFYNSYDYKYVLKKGNVYYVHFTSYSPKSEYSSASIENIKLIPITNSVLSIGKLVHQKGTIDNSTAELPTTDSDYLTDDKTEDSNFRFIGKDAKNYVKFNNELWRVIGVFETKDSNGKVAKRIKIMRNDSITNSSISWDSSIKDINGGNGINEWSQADLMKILNSGYEDNEDIDSNGNNIKVNNSLYWNVQSGKCFTGNGNSISSCDFSSIGLNDNSKKMIDSIVWNTGAMPYDAGSLTPYQVYQYERGNNNGKTNFETSGNDTVTRKVTWTGKVGLPYVSDYIMASSNYYSTTRDTCMSGTSSTYTQCVNSNNWMHNFNSPLATLNVVYGGNFPSFYSPVYSAPAVMPTSQGYTIKPAVYLSTKVVISSGTGTSSDPFILAMGDKDNDTLYYGLVPDLLDEEEKDLDTEINDGEETIDYTKIKNEKVYGFKYDNDTNKFTNENKGIADSKAISYIKLDLTNEINDIDININYNVSKSDYSSMAFINLMKDKLKKIDYDNSNSSSDNSYYNDNILYTDTKKSSVISKTLEKGHVYYLQFAYYKKGNTPVSETNSDSFDINISYANHGDVTQDYVRYDGIVSTLNQEADTVQILKDLLLANSIVIENTRYMNLDLNGHTLTTLTNDYVIKNNGNLVIVDSKYPTISQNTGSIISTAYSTILNSKDAILNVKNANIVLNKSGEYNAITNIGDLTLENNTKVSANNLNNIAIYNDNESKSIINSDYINGYKYGIYNLTTNDIKINVNNLLSNEYGIYNNNEGNIDASISNLEITTDGTAIFNNSDGIITMKNSNFNVKQYGILNNSTGTINLLDSTIVSNIYGIYNMQTGFINVQNSTIKTDDNKSSNYGIYSKESGQIDLISSDILGYKYGIYNAKSGSVNFKSGNIDSFNTGIYNLNGTINIGINEQGPTITGTTYGINTSSGILNINKGNISSTETGIYSVTNSNIKSEITINDGTVKGKKGVEGYATLTINDGIVNGETYGIENRGILVINGGNITSSSNGGSGIFTDRDITINGGDIVSSGDNGKGIYNIGTFKMNGGTIKSTSSTGIGLYTSGKTDIFNGTINGVESGITTSGQAIVNLGVKDQLATKESPRITSKLFGINSEDYESTINFYDGTITGTEDSVINSIINDSEEGYDLFTSTNSEDNSLKNVSLEIPTLEKYGAVAEVDGVSYPSVKLAFDSITSSENKTIKLLKTLPTIVNLGESTKDVTLDSNRNAVRYFGNSTYLVNKNKFNVYDSNDSKGNCIYSKGATIIDNYGSVNYDKSMTLSNPSITAVINHENSEFTLNGSIERDNEVYYYAIDNLGTFIINDAIIKGRIENLNGNINITNSNIYSNSDISINNDSGEINIFGGEIYNNEINGKAIYNKSGKITIVNSDINATKDKSIGISNSGNLVVESGNITGTYNGILNNSELTINDGTISSYGRNGKALEIDNANSITNMYGGIITTSDMPNSTAIYSKSGITNIYSGDVYANGTNNTAIYIGYSGSVNLGIKGDKDSDGNLLVSKNNPNINASQYGVEINDNGIFNFYDGIITGKDAISGPVNDIEDSFDIVSDNDENGNEVKYLDRKLIVKNIRTKKEYYSFADALKEITEGDTLQLIDSLTLLKNASVLEINEDMNFIIDLNGNKISSGNSLFIKNNGNLKIIDSANSKTNNGDINYGNGKLETTGKSLIENSGTLYIDTILISGDYNMGNIITNINSGNLTMTNSKLNINIDSDSCDISQGNNKCYDFNGIYNTSNGTVKIDNSEFYNDTSTGYVTGYSIYNGLNGNIVITNSKFDSNSKESIKNDSQVSMKITNSNFENGVDIMNNSSETLNIENSVLTHVTNLLNGVINIKGGELTNNYSKARSIINETSGTINIDDALINVSSVSSYSIENKSSGIINIGKNSSTNGTNITGKIYNESEGTINVYSGIINSSIYNTNGIINIIDGSINTNNNKSIVNDSGTINIEGGQISSNSTTINSSNILNIKNASINGTIDATGTINMYSGTILSSKVAVYSSGIFNLYDGSIESTGSIGVVLGTSNNNSIINIGIKGDTDELGSPIVSKDSPIIKGKTTGISIYKNSVINLYDGKIIGKQSIDGTISDVEDGYNIVEKTDEENNQVIYLEQGDIIKNLTTNKQYNDLQTAITESSNDDTLQFIRDSKFPSSISTIIIDSGKSITIDLNGNKILSYNSVFIDNKGNLKITDNVGDGIITGEVSDLIKNSGVLEISSACISGNSDRVIYNDGIININDGIVSGKNIGIVNNNELNINSGEINGNYGINNSSYNSTININGGTINASTETGIYNRGIINMNNGKIISNQKGIENVDRGTSNIINGEIESDKYGIYTESSDSIINIGSNDGIVSDISPSIYGKTYGVYNEGVLNFYDGIIKGQSGALSGTLTEVEDGYKVVSNTKDDIISMVLVIIGNDERVAMVNGINFTSLQTAINSVKDNTESNIVIYKDIELTEDIIVPENKIINLYLNGHTITYGDYSFVKNGTLTIIDSAPSESIGASIINTIEKVLNINQNGKNIIIYEMSDGSKLSTENTYNLYKKIDNEYKILSMEKDEEVGRYITGSNNSEMTSIKGRIYLNNLEEGSYKLVSSDNKDIEFTITEDGKVNGNILENTNEKRKVIETAFAYLIITIQTGVNQIKYIIYIVAIVSIILGLGLAFKEQKKLSRKV